MARMMMSTNVGIMCIIKFEELFAKGAMVKSIKRKDTNESDGQNADQTGQESKELHRMFQ